MIDKLKAVVLITTSLVFSSCSESEIPSMMKTSSNPYSIGEHVAVQVAEDFYHSQFSEKSRNHDKLQSTLVPILSSYKSRSSQDTLAYVVNFSRDKAFVIVGGKVCPGRILAFSENELFSFSNEIAVTQFVNVVENYNDTCCWTSELPQRMQEYRRIEPFVKTRIGQDKPFDSYVVREHPGCPAGCVPVATANVMMYSKAKANVHMNDYELTKIRLGLEREAGGNDGYPISVAWDNTAKLLYDIGYELNVVYTSSGSSAYSSDAYDYLVKSGFPVESTFAAFDKQQLLRCLIDDCVVYVRGRDYNRDAGHAWICDGAYYLLDSNGGMNDIYLHFDWGWKGESNGFYNSEFFAASGCNFKPLQYFAVKRECK